MTESGAWENAEGDLVCRTCGKLCEIEDGRLSCNNGCFSEEYKE